AAPGPRSCRQRARRRRLLLAESAPRRRAARTKPTALGAAVPPSHELRAKQPALRLRAVDPGSGRRRRRACVAARAAPQREDSTLALTLARRARRGARPRPATGRRHARTPCPRLRRARPRPPREPRRPRAPAAPA